MKIGLLAYHSSVNFGAFLQLLSTHEYLRNLGHKPIIINWVAEDLWDREQHTSVLQRTLLAELRKTVWCETEQCHDSYSVAKTIEKNGIEAVIIGSDAVAQHHTLLERMVFPSKKIVTVMQYTSDRIFPNPFWAVWLDYLKNKIPVAAISVSCQDSVYKYIHGETRKQMGRRVETYKYLSVRDAWTARMMTWLTQGRVVPALTPDPVFAFRRNAQHMLPSKAEIMARFSLPSRYVLLSFISDHVVSQKWIDLFAELAKRDGLHVVMLPFSHTDSFGHVPHEIHLPLSPTDWFALICYSEGYVGNNMHPIVSALSCGVPFFSFDNYGLHRLNRMVSTDKSSKIRDIVSHAGLSDWRVSCISRRFSPPTPEFVYGQLRKFPRELANQFSSSFLNQYDRMMDDVLSALGGRV